MKETLQELNQRLDSYWQMANKFALVLQGRPTFEDFVVVVDRLDVLITEIKVLRKVIAEREQQLQNNKWQTFKEE